MRFYPTCDENFYVHLKTYSSESKLRKLTPPPALIYRKHGDVHYIPFWRDICPPKGTIMDYEICYKNWTPNNRLPGTCLPVAGGVRFIKLTNQRPAGFLTSPKILSLKELRAQQGTLVYEEDPEDLEDRNDRIQLSRRARRSKRKQ